MLLVFFILNTLATLFIVYFKKRAENLATKKDITGITTKIEEVKSEIYIVSKKNEILLNKKIEVFLELQTIINKCRKECIYRYCRRIDNIVFFNLDSININDYSKPMQEILDDNFIFLSMRARDQILYTIEAISTYPNKDINKEKDEYNLMLKSLDNLIETLYKELNQ